MSAYAKKESFNTNSNSTADSTNEHSFKKSTRHFEDNRPLSVTQRRLNEMVNNYKGYKPPANLPAMPFSSPIQRKPLIQFVKDKGDKLAQSVAATWKIELSDAKKFVAWCKDENEVKDWEAYNSYDEWVYLQSKKPDEHDSEVIAEILAKRSQSEKKPTAKPKPKEPTQEELLIQQNIEYEKQRAEKRSAEKANRKVELDGFNLVPGNQVTGDPVLSKVWPAILDEYQQRINPNLTISTSFSNAQLLAALTIWRTGTDSLRSNAKVSYVSTFQVVQDKSEREDGGKNSVNLDKRECQANFIIEINGYRINAHVNQS